MSASVGVSSILGAEGAVARRLGGLYEYRPQQIEMAEKVAEALSGQHHLMVEAGTGVGKSFAYLLPAIDFAVRNKKRVVVSTHTISLQEQLIEKDIPLLRSVYPEEFTAVLVKGRSNYLCQRRMEQARGRQGMLFDQPKQLQSLRTIVDWSRKTTDGSLSDLPGAVEPSVWERCCAEQGNCLGKKCEFYKDCFWQAAKRRMMTGNILVVNHALFFADLALRISGVNYLPKYDVVILDEAHTVEDVAADHFGLNISEYRLNYQLRTLYDPERGRGLLNSFGSFVNPAIDTIVNIHGRMEEFWQGLIDWQRNNGRDNGRIHEPRIVENTMSPLFHELALRLKAVLPGLEKAEEISELNTMAEKVSVFGQELEALLEQRLPDAVYWMEMGSRSRRNVSLHASPVNIAEGLRAHLFGNMASVIMTSATMCTGGTGRASARAPGKAEDPHASSRQVGISLRSTSKHPEYQGRGQGDGAFSYMMSRLGAEGAKTLELGSPFDYAKQVTLYIESELPEPNDTLRFAPAACGKIVEYLKQTEGGAFVLFTSHSALLDAAARMRGALEELGYPMLVQGRDVPRKVLLERFRVTPHAVLLGTASFWQGIDVRGDALRNVIIVKLPFSVPDEPVIEARLEAITRAGGNPFMEYSVPEAIIRLKQGFGRLIRSKTDTGIVVILDSRIKTKRYGKRFLSALPECNVVVQRRKGVGS